MYKVCFVDDEVINYQLFEKLVDWKEKGFSIVGTASDGLEALQLYEQEHPDLIFMDIQLPRMDGLECVRCIREEDKQVQIVIVSAYNDFSFAQKAIKYGVKEFLLKPVSRTVLNQLVDKIREDLDTKNQMEEKVNYFHSPVTEEFQAVESLCKMIVTSEDGGEIGEEQLKESLELLTQKKEIAEGLKFVLIRENRFVFIGWENEAQPRPVWKAILEFFLEKKYKCEIYPFQNSKQWGSATECFEQMRQGANFGFYDEKSSIYAVDEYPFIEEEMNSDELERVIYESLAKYQLGILQKFLEEAFHTARAKKIDPEILKTYTFDALLKIKFILKKYDKNASFFIMRKIKMDEINNAQSFRSLYEYAETKISEAFHDMNESMLHAATGNMAVFQANAFAELYFAKTDFSLKKTADFIGLSKNYFASLYKEQVGIGFWEHVTNLRMEKAKEYLVTSEYIISVIAGAVGYESEYHFSRKFKEIIGQTPNQYRRNRNI